MGQRIIVCVCFYEGGERERKKAGGQRQLTHSVVDSLTTQNKENS